MSTATRFTAEQLLDLPRDGNRYELVAGELRQMTPSGWRHGAIGGNLHALLGAFVLENRLGQMFFAETGFLLARDPDTVRAPDVAFIRRDRLPTILPDEAYWPGAPDLAVEVVSPGDTVGEVDAKVKCWLDAGALMVWVVNPQWRNVTVYRSSTDIVTLTEGDEFDGQDVVPGFRCPVDRIFMNLGSDSSAS
jgi:Uma2 family endonuclease